MLEQIISNSVLFHGEIWFAICVRNSFPHTQTDQPLAMPPGRHTLTRRTWGQLYSYVFKHAFPQGRSQIFSCICVSVCVSALILLLKLWFVLKLFSEFISCCMRVCVHVDFKESLRYHPTFPNNMSKMSNDLGHWAKKVIRQGFICHKFI